MFGEAGATGCARWVDLEPEHIDAQTAEQVENAMDLRLIEQRTAQHGSRRHVHLLDPGKALGEALVQPSLDPDTEAPRALMAVVLFDPHVMECQATPGGMASPFG